MKTLLTAKNTVIASNKNISFMKRIILLILVFVMNSCYNQETLVDKSKLNGYDYRLYQSTPAWTLANAVKAEDIEKIKEEVLQKKSPYRFSGS